MQPEVRDAVPKCLHKRRVEGDNHSACWKCRADFWGGLSELCSPDVRCIECIDTSPFIYDLVNKNIEKLTKRTEQRRAKSKDDSSLVDDDKGDLSIGLSTSQIDSLYSELSPPFTVEDEPDPEGTLLDRDWCTKQARANLRFFYSVVQCDRTQP